MTLAAFRAWEERQPMRYEFNGFSAEATTGGTAAHAVIQANLALALGSRLRGTPCRFIGNDLKIHAGANSSRYPDGFAVCTPIDPEATAGTDPAMIFEVLSPSTAPKDRIIKNKEYAEAPSVQSDVMLEQNRIGAAVFSRAKGDWAGDVRGKGDTLLMPGIAAGVPLAELYDGLTFDPEDETRDPPPSG